MQVDRARLDISPARCLAVDNGPADAWAMVVMAVRPMRGDAHIRRPGRVVVVMTVVMVAMMPIVVVMPPRWDDLLAIVVLCFGFGTEAHFCGRKVFFLD